MTIVYDELKLKVGQNRKKSEVKISLKAVGNDCTYLTISFEYNPDPSIKTK